MNDIVNNFAEETNPVIDTARLTISQLAVSGVREAIDLADMFGLTESMKNYQVTNKTIYPFAII